MDPLESGARRQNLQVGGTGEGNLPKKSYTVISEKESFLIISGVLRDSGDFKSEYNKFIVKQAVEEFAPPYLPWATQKAVEKRKSYDCSNTTAEVFPGNARKDQFESGITSQKNQNIRKKRKANGIPKSHFSTLSQPPKSEVVPRLKSFSGLLALSNCWRFGIPDQNVPPLFMLLDSSGRRDIWPGCTDSWWKKSGHKAAYTRIKHIISLVASSGERCSEKEVGSDITWSNTIDQINENWDNPKLYKVLEMAPKQKN